MNKFRRKSILMVLLILLIVIVSVFSLYSAYNVNKDKQASKRNKESTNIDVYEEEEEVVPDTNRVYKNLDRGIDVINYLDTSLQNKITDIYKNEINIKDIEYNYKLYSVLFYLYNEKAYDEITEEDYNRLYEGLYMEEKREYYGSIKFDDVKSLYKKVYNQDLEAGSEVNIDGYCPIFKYDNNNYYFGTYDCDKPRSVLNSYKYKYVIGEDSADVYIALGVVEYDFNFKAYKYDMYKDTVLKESETDILLDINRKNYDEYSKYIIHFVNVNGDYYVSNIRKVMN